MYNKKEKQKICIFTPLREHATRLLVDISHDRFKKFNEDPISCIERKNCFQIIYSDYIYEWNENQKDRRGEKYDGAYIDLEYDETYIVKYILPFLIKAKKEQIFVFYKNYKNLTISEFISKLNIIKMIYGDLLVKYNYDNYNIGITGINIITDKSVSEENQQIVLLN